MRFFRLRLVRPRPLPLIFELCLTGLFLAVAVVLALATFRVGGSGVYLVGVPLFVLPFLVRAPLAVGAALLGVVLADLITGWIAYTWISVLVYGAVVIWLCLVQRLTTRAVVLWAALALSAGVFIALYFFLLWAVLGLDLAIGDAVATSIQAGIVFPLAGLLIFPLQALLRHFVQARWAS